MVPIKRSLDSLAHSCPNCSSKRWQKPLSGSVSHEKGRAAVRINATLITVLYWSARVLAVMVFLFWGAFFLEHLSWFFKPVAEWPPIFKPAAEWPPARVWLLQLAHLAMLIGLLVLLRWELAGTRLDDCRGTGVLRFGGRESIPALLRGHESPRHPGVACSVSDPGRFQGGWSAIAMKANPRWSKSRARDTLRRQPVYTNPTRQRGPA